MIDAEGSVYLVADIFGVKPEDVDPKVSEPLETLLDTLARREQTVLELRYGLKNGICRTLEGTSPALGYISRERVRQIHAKVLKKLRDPSQSRHLKPFIKPGAKKDSRLVNRPYWRQQMAMKSKRQTQAGIKHRNLT